jgi:hypothetical protein
MSQNASQSLLILFTRYHGRCILPKIENKLGAMLNSKMDRTSNYMVDKEFCMIESGMLNWKKKDSPVLLEACNTQYKMRLPEHDKFCFEILRNGKSLESVEDMWFICNNCKLTSATLIRKTATKLEVESFELRTWLWNNILQNTLARLINSMIGFHHEAISIME